MKGYIDLIKPEDLSAARVGSNLTQQELAYFVGVNVKTIRNFENDPTRIPRIALMGITYFFVAYSRPVNENKVELLSDLAELERKVHAMRKRIST